MENAPSLGNFQEKIISTLILGISNTSKKIVLCMALSLIYFPQMVKFKKMLLWKELEIEFVIDLIFHKFLVEARE